LHKNNPQTQYFFDGKLIELSDVVKDLGRLGVNIDSSLEFPNHIDRIVVKAYSRIGVLFRGFVSRNLLLLKQAYITYIRPLLEYASNVWSPYLLTHINALERVQRHHQTNYTTS
jgi:hypothetical protein